MVLQHTQPVVAGRCLQGTNVTAVLAVLTTGAGDVIVDEQATPCAGGRFLLTLSPRAPSNVRHTITVSAGTATATARGVLFGTVLLCGGQSNMGFTTAGEDNSTAELAVATTANYPLVRLFGLKSANTSVEAWDVVPRWKQGWANLTVPGETNKDANPVAQFSAVCWNAGKTIVRLLKQSGQHGQHPLGLIDASLGSTRAECWMPPPAVASCRARYNASNPGKDQMLGKCSHVAWSGPPGTFFNGMIAPLARSVRPAAAVYYQGENNMWDGIDAYHCSGDALANTWRAAFTDSGPGFPWFVVQLAPCSGDNDGLIAGSYIREAQRRTALTVGDAHLIVLNDVGDAGVQPAKASGYAPATHPRNKTEPGRRLGLQFWSRLFPDQAGAPNSQQWPPAVKSVERSRDGASITVAFTNASGLHWHPTHNCTVYTNASIAGEGSPCCGPATEVAQFSNASTPDQGYSFTEHWVFSPASILHQGQGGVLVVKVPQVPAGAPPFLWFRFQFDSQPLCVLANDGALPTSLFVLPVPPVA